MWKQIENTKYEISENGEIRNSKTGRILSQWNHNYGYRGITLFIDNKKKNYLVHRLVGEYFIPNFDSNLPVHHVDGVKHNNHISNLENVTTLENNRKRNLLGRYISDIEFIIKVVEHYNNNKLTPQEIFIKIRDEYSC